MTFFARGFIADFLSICSFYEGFIVVLSWFASYWFTELLCDTLGYSWSLVSLPKLLSCSSQEPSAAFGRFSASLKERSVFTCFKACQALQWAFA